MLHDPWRLLDDNLRDLEWARNEAIQYLGQFAPRTTFAVQAQGALAMRFDGQQLLLTVADLLDEWVRYAEQGMADRLPAAARARISAATDLMEQVQTLLDDNRVHPAAPVVLAGAALEELLRSLVIQHGASVRGKPGLTTYATVLRSVDALSPQDVKDVTAWAGQRNEAAHGKFESLSRDRAQLMVDGINLFMRQKTP